MEETHRGIELPLPSTVGSSWRHPRRFDPAPLLPPTPHARASSRRPQPGAAAHTVVWELRDPAFACGGEAKEAQEQLRLAMAEKAAADEARVQAELAEHGLAAAPAGVGRRSMGDDPPIPIPTRTQPALAVYPTRPNPQVSKTH
jgi:hypothetical protein